MATDDKTIQIYVAHLRGKIIVVHGTSQRETTVAKQLAGLLIAWRARDTECLPINVKELSHAVGKVNHIVLVFNSLDSLTKKLAHAKEFITQISHKRETDLVIVCNSSQVPKTAPFIYFMQFNFDEEVQHLVVKCLAIFGGNSQCTVMESITG